MVHLLSTRVIFLSSLFRLTAPRDVKVQQIWPGQVQVVWSYENLRNVVRIFSQKVPYLTQKSNTSRLHSWLEMSCILPIKVSIKLITAFL